MSELGFKMSDDLVRLSSLLNPEKSDDDDDDAPDSSYASLNPGSIGTNKSKKATTTAETPYAKKTAAAADPDDIWNDAEVQEGSVFNQEDPRPAPQYDLVLKQKVTSEDMFLGMSGKNPSSACCEEMVVKIELPGTAKMSDVDLDIKSDTLDCQTPQFRLLLPLPHPVDPKRGQAQWHPDKCILEVTLVMQREYDYINFQ